MPPRMWMTQIQDGDAPDAERYAQIMGWLTELIREIDSFTDSQANFIDESYDRFVDNPAATMSDKQYYWLKGLIERLHSPSKQRRKKLYPGRRLYE